jgi:hypothetical protein
MMRWLPILLLSTGLWAQSSLWTTQAPKVPDAADNQQVELGTRFTSDTAGQITALRFWKSARNTGPHTLTLWLNSSRTKLVQSIALNEPASGWVTVQLVPPIAIQANTGYTVSYHNMTTGGHYADDQYYFTSKYDNPPLHAPVNAGVYTYGNLAYPVSTWHSSNYWVDVVFQPTQVVQHKVALSWSESTASVTFNVLRSKTSGGPYSNVALGLQAKAYTDTNVKAGEIWYYVVYARDTNNHLSPKSNEQQAVIPSP